MSSPFRAAWMLLKQRGHELNLPEPRRQNVGPNAANMSPQDLTDARVDAHSNAVSEMDKFRDMDVDGYRGIQQPSELTPMEQASNRLHDRQMENDEMEGHLVNATEHNMDELYHNQEQRGLDRETLSRMGQQGEADEIGEMGVPEMSRTMGGRTPPNIGRAGSTDVGEETMSAMDEDVLTPENITAFQDFNYRKRRDPVTGDLSNPFPKPLAGRVQDRLTEFADGAGRQAAMQPQPDYSDDTRISNEMDEITGNPLNNEIPESSPESHNIASTNIRGSPRQNKRGKMDSERVTPRMQGRAARSSSPFMGGQ